MAKAKLSKKLALFLWEGTNKRGAKIRGEMSGGSTALVKAELRRQGITPLKVGKKPSTLFAPRPKKITSTDIAVFSRQLATMMSAGIPLVQAFDIVGRGHANASMQNMIFQIKADIETGTTLADALSKHPRYFDNLYCSLVAAGETSGSLDTMLKRIATYREKIETLKGKIKKTLFYPTAVLMVAFIVTTILLIFVVPQFESLFHGFGAELPAFTQLVLNISAFFQSYWWLIFGAAAGGVYAFVAGRRRSTKFAHLIDRYMLKIPVIGPILEKACVARYARTLSTTFAAGLPLTDALTAVSGAVGNIVFHDAVVQIRDDVATGQQLQLAMSSSKLFSNMVIQMVAIGEESGSLDDMLSKVADAYEEDVDNAVDSMSSLLEPLIMVILGVIIGGLIAAMYLPIFKLGSVV